MNSSSKHSARDITASIYSIHYVVAYYVVLFLSSVPLMPIVPEIIYRNAGWLGSDHLIHAPYQKPDDRQMAIQFFSFVHLAFSFKVCKNKKKALKEIDGLR